MSMRASVVFGFSTSGLLVLSCVYPSFEVHDRTDGGRGGASDAGIGGADLRDLASGDGAQGAAVAQDEETAGRSGGRAGPEMAAGGAEAETGGASSGTTPGAGGASGTVAAAGMSGVPGGGGSPGSSGVSGSSAGGHFGGWGGSDEPTFSGGRAGDVSDNFAGTAGESPSCGGCAGRQSGGAGLGEGGQTGGTVEPGSGGWGGSGGVPDGGEAGSGGSPGGGASAEGGQAGGEAGSGGSLGGGASAEGGQAGGSGQSGDGGAVGDGGSGGATGDSCVSVGQGVLVCSDATEPCRANHICLRLELGEPLATELRRLTVVQYTSAPEVTPAGVGEPAVSYATIVAASLPLSGPFVVQQDFRVPRDPGSDYTGSRYVGAFFFTSPEDEVGLSGIDYWYVTLAARDVGLGDAVDLGQVEPTLIPVADDPSIPGDEGIGRVTCIAQPPGEVVADPPTCFREPCCFDITNITSGGGLGACGCSADIDVACDGPEDCGSGEVCCGADWEHHSCVPAGSCGFRAVCHTPADCGEGDVCKAGTMFNAAYCISDNPDTPGDERPGMVNCSMSSIGPCDGLCCIGVVSSDWCSLDGTCNAGSSQAEWRCDGPEDCESGERCCQNSTGSNSCNTSTCPDWDWEVCSGGSVLNTGETCP